MRRRTDKNQKEIVTALRAIGALVFITSMVGHGFPDIVVGYRGKIYLMEIKSGSPLTPDEETFHHLWAEYACIVNSIEEALEIIGAVND